jgi:hypothetical protein
MSTISSELPIAKVNLVFETRNRRRLLLVKCKWALEYSPERAAVFRRDLSENWDLDAPFFMLAFTGGLYLWSREMAPDALPKFMASPQSIWEAYVGERGMGPEGIRAHGVEIAVRVWLEDLAWGIRELDLLSEADRMLVQSGLYELMRDGTARFDDIEP